MSQRCPSVDLALAVHLEHLGMAGVFPVNFYPSGHTRGSDRMEVFREAWHLMAPGADLSRPRTLRHARIANLHHKHFVQ
jgi:hypothetical protein